MSAKRGAIDEIPSSMRATPSTGPCLGVELADAVSGIEAVSSPSAVDAAAEPVDAEVPDASVSATAEHAIVTKASENISMLNLERLTASYQECDY